MINDFYYAYVEKYREIVENAKSFSIGHIKTPIDTSNESICAFAFFETSSNCVRSRPVPTKFTKMKFLLCCVFLATLVVISQAKENGTTPSSGSTRQSTTDKVSTVKVSTVKVDANKTANNSKNLKASDPFQNRLNQVANDCKKELNAQQDIVALLSSGALPTNEKQRCFLECVYNKIGLIKDNKLSEEGATNLAKQKFGENKDMTAKADALFKKCKTEAVVTEKDAKEKCALGRLIRTCIVNHGQGLPIFATKA